MEKLKNFKILWNYLKTDKGKLVETGISRELLKNNAIYKNLYDIESNSMIE